MIGAVTKGELRPLRKYLVGTAPNAKGEWDMLCPLHHDNDRSANLNMNTAVWYCHKGCGGGPIGQLLARQAEFIPLEGREHSNGNGSGSRSASLDPEPLPSDTKVSDWTNALLKDKDDALSTLIQKRGLNDFTVSTYELGWDVLRACYTIPVYDRKHNLINVRRYQLDPPPGRRKMRGLRGHNDTVLYPLDQLEADTVLITEGELDALICIQNGFPAITKTGSALTWYSTWNKLFTGKTVYVCCDADDAGQKANRKIAYALAEFANVYILDLGYAVEPKHGKDITDWWLENDDSDAFRQLLDKAVRVDDPRIQQVAEIQDARPIDALDSRRARQPLRLTVTIEGKASPGYTIPKKVMLTCDQTAGAVCNHCPLNSASGRDTFHIAADDTALEMMDAPSGIVAKVIKVRYGLRCKDRWHMDVLEEQGVETLFARASVDDQNGNDEQDFTTIRIRHVGGHDTPSNETVQVVGSLYPNPKSQVNEFVASEVRQVETSLDRFDFEEANLKLLHRFKCKKGESPLVKLGRINAALEQHVTHIYGRREMHMAMDLVWHSALAFIFDGQLVERGWLELLVLGDTRTGKSEAARLLLRHYRAGELVSCETASIAGVLGGVQQPTGQQWTITWGKVPLNDRRLVVLDEVDGLSHEDIGRLSHLRSSGVAELTKVKQAKTRARCRLIWLGNPREGKIADATFGVDALEPLIGKPEDIARFDLAMTVAYGEVESEAMNSPSQHSGTTRYTSDACHQLLRWCWSRKPEHIKWIDGAEAAVFDSALDMGRRYIESPPLVQAANVRIKIARLAVALAMRTFSTDESCEAVLVTRQHVLDAVKFMDRLYALPGFGYAQRSRERIQAAKEARAAEKHVRRYLENDPEIRAFLLDRGSHGNSWFKRWDLESFLDLTREEANALLNKFWQWRMLEGAGGDVRPNQTLRKILREMGV